MPEVSARRKQLLERLRDFRVVPGHGPVIDDKTDDQLELYVNLLETMFSKAFEED